MYDINKQMVSSSHQAGHLVRESQGLPLEEIPAKDFFDINAICPVQDNVLATGADDGVVKLWDTRALDNQAKPIGGFIGHTDGIIALDSTYQHDRGNQIKVCSNSKDQTIKLWDIRKANSTQEIQDYKAKKSIFDYRCHTVFIPSKE
eukprot:CAMPEP_0170547184 /NCGR_PEP_ID=MMETSP0211-20121228/5525_1 /TAXON_ID=311385 /ORGANISM="Pseudokeronopsis sp., Strain OXSARD2" /LENGTH=146 /DNA_ID=CAMNT_0010852037 /DNA_START=1131 /DNA_END=1571 /DNA_ORIENTATION=-